MYPLWAVRIRFAVKLANLACPALSALSLGASADDVAKDKFTRRLWRFHSGRTKPEEDDVKLFAPHLGFSVAFLSGDRPEAADLEKLSKATLTNEELLELVPPPAPPEIANATPAIQPDASVPPPLPPESPPVSPTPPPVPLAAPAGLKASDVYRLRNRNLRMYIKQVLGNSRSRRGTFKWVAAKTVPELARKYRPNDVHPTANRLRAATRTQKAEPLAFNDGRELENFLRLEKYAITVLQLPGEGEEPRPVMNRQRRHPTVEATAPVETAAPQTVTPPPPAPPAPPIVATPPAKTAVVQQPPAITRLLGTIPITVPHLDATMEADVIRDGDGKVCLRVPLSAADTMALAFRLMQPARP